MTRDEAVALPHDSVAGAPARSLDPDLAARFFQRIIGGRYPLSNEAEASGVFDDGSEQIAAYPLASVSDAACRVQIAVVPECRRRRIGGELLYMATADCARRGGLSLIGSHPVRADEARTLVASLEAACARLAKRGEGEGEGVDFIPMMGPRMEEGAR